MNSFLYNKTARVIDQLPANLDKIKLTLLTWRTLCDNIKDLNAKELYIAFQTEIEGKNRTNLVNALRTRYYKVVNKHEIVSGKSYDIQKKDLHKDSTDKKLLHKASHFKSMQEA